MMDKPSSIATLYESDDPHQDRLKQLEEERQRLEVTKLKHDAGMLSSRDATLAAERLEWMYAAKGGQSESNDLFEVGKPLVGTAGGAGSGGVDKQGLLVDDGFDKTGSLFLKSVTKTDADTLRKLREDPLFIIQQAEAQYRREKKAEKAARRKWREAARATDEKMARIHSRASSPTERQRDGVGRISTSDRGHQSPNHRSNPDEGCGGRERGFTGMGSRGERWRRGSSREPAPSDAQVRGERVDGNRRMRPAECVRERRAEGGGSPSDAPSPSVEKRRRLANREGRRHDIGTERRRRESPGLHSRSPRGDSRRENGRRGGGGGYSPSRARQRDQQSAFRNRESEYESADHLYRHRARESDHHRATENDHHRATENDHHRARENDHHPARESDHHPARESDHHRARESDHHRARESDHHRARESDHHRARESDHHRARESDHHRARESDHHRARESDHHRADHQSTWKQSKSNRSSGLAKSGERKETRKRSRDSVSSSSSSTLSSSSASSANSRNRVALGKSERRSVSHANGAKSVKANAAVKGASKPTDFAKMCTDFEKEKLGPPALMQKKRREQMEEKAKHVAAADAVRQATMGEMREALSGGGSGGLTADDIAERARLMEEMGRKHEAEKDERHKHREESERRVEILEEIVKKKKGGEKHFKESVSGQVFQKASDNMSERLRLLSARVSAKQRAVMRDEDPLF